MTTVIQKVRLVIATGLVAFAALLLVVVVSSQTAFAAPLSQSFAVAASCSSSDGLTNGTFDQTADKVCCPLGSETSALGCFFAKYVNPVVALISAAVGVAVVISLIYAGIQYSSAGGDPGKLQAAKQRIMNSIIALVIFFFIFAGLSWLIPGGIL